MFLIPHSFARPPPVQNYAAQQVWVNFGMGGQSEYHAVQHRSDRIFDYHGPFDHMDFKAKLNKYSISPDPAQHDIQFKRLG